MNDSIMYTWDVKVAGSHGYGTLFTCARKETAEYLRDWCEAEHEEYQRNSFPIMQNLMDEKDFAMIIRNQKNGISIFSVCESEVIL